MLNQLTYPSGRIVTYSYDTEGRPQAIQTKLGTAPGVTLLSQIAYQPFGPAKGWTYGNGEVRSSSFDQNGRMTSLTLGDSTLTLSYDTGGRLVEQRMAGGWWDRLLQRLGLPVGQTDLFDYDKLDRLTAWQANSQTRLYDYDATGNRTRVQSSSVAQDQTIDPASNRLIAGAGVYQYDRNGNRVTDSRQSYRYDVRGRLIEAGGAQYTVNAFGERVIKTYQGQTTLYHYDQWGRLLAETDAQGVTRREYIYLGALPVAVIDFGTEIRYIHTDHLGTPRLVTDAAKQAIWAWRGEPFGATPADEDPSGTNAPYAFNLRFPGQYFDKETGLHYNYYRDYDPQIGRYLQSDPIGLAGGINTYAYALGNPIIYSDPLGLAVYLCRQPAFGISNNPIDHHWIKTDSIEAGMGPVKSDCGNAGNASGDLPGDAVQVCDHSKRDKTGSTCTKVTDVDEQKVNGQLRLGRWGPTNQCQSYAREVLNNARTTQPSTESFDNPYLWGF